MFDVTSRGVDSDIVFQNLSPIPAAATTCCAAGRKLLDHDRLSDRAGHHLAGRSEFPGLQSQPTGIDQAAEVIASQL